jgi:mono/diheme cytochrome c family protein
MECPAGNEARSSLFLTSIAICLWIIAVALPDAASSDGKQTHDHHEGHWSAPHEAANRPNPIPLDQTSIERGRELFQNKCALCHGTTGKGDGSAAKGLDPKPANLAEMSAHHPDGDIAWKIATGRGPMPAWKDILTENDIWDLTNFINNLGTNHH